MIGTDTTANVRALSPAALVRIEAAALDALATRLEGPMSHAFETALDLLLRCVADRRRVLVTGLGKSGLIARKIAATLCSTGVPAHFLHPSDALHGDLGMLAEGDILLALSASGTPEEILSLLPTVRRVHGKVVALCGVADSPLGRSADVFLDAGVDKEACPHDLAPTASTTVTLALGDALAITASIRRGFSPQHFADLHPGGRIGRRLARVEDLMHAGEALPCVSPETPMTEVIYEMSRKKLGMTTVIGKGGKLLGMISDGDLRRLLQQDGRHALEHTAEQIMNRNPVTVTAQTFAPEALRWMEERKITSLIVIDEGATVQGAVHIHDLWEALGPELADRTAKDLAE